jgi:hypothetical protein
MLNCAVFPAKKCPCRGKVNYNDPLKVSSVGK